MITRKDAIALGVAIVSGMQKEEAFVENSKWQDLGVKTQARCSARGSIINALDNLWYEVFPDKVKESFMMRRDDYYKAVGWK